MDKETMQEKVRSFYETWEDEIYEATAEESARAFKCFLLDDNDGVYEWIGKYI